MNRNRLMLNKVIKIIRSRSNSHKWIIMNREMINWIRVYRLEWKGRINMMIVSWMNIRLSNIRRRWVSRTVDNHQWSIDNHRRVRNQREVINQIDPIWVRNRNRKI